MVGSCTVLSSLVVPGLATNGALAQTFSLQFTGVPDSPLVSYFSGPCQSGCWRAVSGVPGDRPVFRVVVPGIG